MKIKFFLFLFILNTTIVFSTEERDSIPFFSLKTYKITVTNLPPQSSICRGTSKKVIKYSKIEQFECTPVTDSKLDEVFRKTAEEHLDKKEIQFFYFDPTGKIVNPIIKANGREYNFISYIYKKKGKLAYMEVTDSDKKYYFYQISPERVKVKNK